MAGHTYKVGDRIVYPATAYHGASYPDFAGTVVSVGAYLKVQFDAIKVGDVRTIAIADLVSA